MILKIESNLLETANDTKIQNKNFQMQFFVF